MHKFIPIYLFIVLFLPLISSSSEIKVKEIVKIEEHTDEFDRITFVDLIDRIDRYKIIYIGEIHDNKKHHEIQLDLIKGIYKNNSRLAIGMEMFQARFQEMVNSYLLGNLEEEDFLKQVQYEKKWGFDFDLYKPILDFAKMKYMPIIALNADSELVREVSRNGISTLGAALLNQLPGFIDFDNEEYKKHLYDIFKNHPETKNKDFQRFYQVQLLWDESMAHNIDEFLKANPDYKIIVITGNGHIVYDYGIPSRVYGRNHYDYATITIDTDESKGISDYLIKTSN